MDVFVLVFKQFITTSKTNTFQSGDFYGAPAYFSTAYFVDPSIICEGGRSEAEFNSQGVGDRLLFQSSNGYVEAPLTQVDMEDKTLCR